MPKKKQRELVPPTPEAPTVVDTLPPPNLMGIREQLMADNEARERTLAKLKTWRTEIDATIAFLEAQNK